MQNLEQRVYRDLGLLREIRELRDDVRRGFGRGEDN